MNRSELSPKALEVLGVLERDGYGRVHALHTEVLAEKVGMGKSGPFKNGDYQSLRNLIMELRDAGVPVCGDMKGYFMPRNMQEAEQTLSRLESAGRSYLRRAAAIRRGIAAREKEEVAA